MDPYSLFDTRMRGEFYQTGRLRRSTLTSLRWMAVAGQLVSLFVVQFILKIEVPLLACFVVIATSIILNIAITLLLPLDRLVSNAEAGGQLLFDVLALSALLYFTGGMQNPFALLLLAPVVVSAKTLDMGVFACMAMVVAGLSFALLFFHMPLPWFTGETISLPQMYQYGSWLALLVGTLFTSSYAWRTTAQTKRITQALAATDAILAHEKKLSALGGLAAAAAHKLGTPLSTIQVVAKEIANVAKPDSELADDAELLLSQAKHCREILQELGRRGDKGDIMFDQINLTELIREITEPFIGFEAQINTQIIHPKSGEAEPILTRTPEFVYGLTNIVENAVDFAEAKVKVIGTWSEQSLSIEVIDDGPGFAASVLAKVGEPYISYRPDKKHSAGGMGLGVFIATTLFQRVGGTIKFSNREDAHGARVQMCWPIDNQLAKNSSLFGRKT
ncbi:MAG: ActS/PrrB/RegB family redox-sensitive histidine kinase [Robiginitomaculum sp.]|nr:ActS/PrrB/RegB family redox-sensitive histidine kinase [Robiginitomaculum sp.]